VNLDPLPLGAEAAGEMLPPGFDLGHPVGCFQSLAVPLPRLAPASEIRLVRLVPVEDVADDVMHCLASVSA
jgi:hypothetical protein